jgi:hypothetical protein
VPTCIVHIGTHKTGTTALQLFTEHNRTGLRDTGLTLVQTGRTSGFTHLNHRLPWGLLGGDAATLLPALTAELRAIDSASFITSEDLSLLHDRPHLLAGIAEAIRNGGHTPKVLVYLRQQATFAESMAVERMKHGDVRTVGAFVGEILATGQCVPKGLPVAIEFRYSRLLNAWADAFGRENVVVRPYDPKRETRFIFDDFLGTVAQVAPGFGSTPLQLQVAQPRANDSVSFGALLETAFTKLLPRRPQQLSPAAIFASQLPDFPKTLFDQRFALLTREETLAFLGAFGPDNAAVERDYGIHIPFQHESDIMPADDPIWQKARLERPLYDQLLTLWMAEAQRQSGNGSS